MWTWQKYSIVENEILNNVRRHLKKFSTTKTKYKRGMRNEDWKKKIIRKKYVWQICFFSLTVIYLILTVQETLARFEMYNDKIRTGSKIFENLRFRGETPKELGTPETFDLKIKIRFYIYSTNWKECLKDWDLLQT